jgi:hypothetical protein
VLVIHIGTHKTGTSAIQSFIRNRAEKLEAKGIHYVNAARTAGNAHHELSWGLRGRRGADLSAWSEVRRELAESRFATNVISTEAFWFTDPAAIKEQLGDAARDVRIVMYLRRQDKYLQSLYKQTVSGGRKTSFPEWRDNFLFRGEYLSVVRQWADAFGKESLVIRPYERGGKTIDAVVDFLGLLGVDAIEEFQRKKAGSNNPSPRRELLEFIRAFNQLDIDVNREKFFFGVVRRQEAYVRSADLLTYEECVSLMEHFADMNRELIREFYRDPEPLFPAMKRSEPPRIWAPDSEEYFQLIVDVLTEVWNIARDPEGGKPKSFKHRKRDGEAKKADKPQKPGKAQQSPKAEPGADGD